jgi:hypothetical protein
LPSVLQETVEWREGHGKSYDFVDPEIGNFAKGVLSAGAQFSYLHIVSDNLTRDFRDNLSNERDRGIPAKRLALYGVIERILSKRLRPIA